jgi:hypothetical protein
MPTRPRFAVDAKTGKPVYSLGREAILPLVNNALEFAYPPKYPATVDPVSLVLFPDEPFDLLSQHVLRHPVASGMCDRTVNPADVPGA